MSSKMNRLAAKHTAKQANAKMEAIARIEAAKIAAARHKHIPTGKSASAAKRRDAKAIHDANAKRHGWNTPVNVAVEAPHGFRLILQVCEVRGILIKYEPIR